MTIPITPGWNVEIPPGADDWRERGRTTRLRHHFAEVSLRYRSLRELDLGAVRVISGVLASAADRGQPLRLLDVGTGAGRYLEAVGESLSAALVSGVFPIGLDLTPAMLKQARIRNGNAGLRAQHVVSTVEMLPFHASSCDAITCFNAVHHFDLARFMGEASRVLTPSGHLVLYTRTPEQNQRTDLGPLLSRVRHAGNQTASGRGSARGLRVHQRLRVGSHADCPVEGRNVAVSTRRTSHPLSLFDLPNVFG